MPHWTKPLILLLALLLAPPAFAQVDPTTGMYRTAITDLSVKVLGGQVSFVREYKDNRWRFAPAWSRLKFEYDALDGSILRITRVDNPYERLDSAGTLYRFDERHTLRKTDTGYRWSDRDGNWMDYAADGRALAFGNRTPVGATFVYDGEHLSGVRDHFGRQVLWIEGSGDQRTRVRDHTGREVTYTYTSGRLTQVTDVRGHAWRYAYSSGRLTQLIDPLNRTTTLTLTSDGRMVRLTDPTGAETRYRFDYLNAQKLYYLRTTRPNGDLAEVTEVWTDRDRETVRRDINGITVLKVLRDGRKRIHLDYRERRTVYDYDEFKNLTAITWPDGTKVSTRYATGLSNPIEQTNELGVVTEHQYNPMGLRTRTIEAKGTEVERSTTYDYDDLGRLTSVTQVGDAQTETAITRYDYDNDGNVTKIIDAEEGETLFADFDAIGNPHTRTDARGKVWAQTFDPAGNLLTFTDPLNHTTSYAFDPVGNRTSVTYPPAEPGADAAVTRYEYDGRNRLLRTIDALGGVSRNVYDRVGNLVERTDPSNEASRYTYDPMNRIVTMIDGIGNLTRHVYPDAADPSPHAGDIYQPVRIEYPTSQRELKHDARSRIWERTEVFATAEGQQTRTSVTRFDAAGHVVEQIDPVGRSSYSRYDALGRFTKLTDALGGETVYAYDRRDNLLALTDANGNTHRFTYDRLNRTTAERRPMGQTTSFVYDANGNLSQKLDPRGQNAEYGYDDAGQRIEVRYFEAGATEPLTAVAFAYDARGNLMRYDDRITSATYRYDLLSRKLEEAVDYGPFIWTHAYTYYPNGRKASYTAVDGSVLTYGYDLSGNLQAITIPGEGSIQYGDYRWTRPQTVNYPGGTLRSLGYDGLMRTETIRVENLQSAVLMDYRFRYDEAGNIVEKQTEHGLYRYGYDALDRLILADYPNGQGVNDSFAPDTFPFEDDEYTYDPLGNRLTDARQTHDFDWQYNANNELLHSGFSTYQYNEAGSTIAKRDPDTELPIQSYTYNTEERLIKVRDPDGNLVAEYYYDPFGRRLWKVLHPSADGHEGGSEPETHFMAYSDEGYAAEYVHRGDGMPEPTQARTLLFAFAADGLWSSDPVAKKQPTDSEPEWLYYQTDQLGAPMQLIASGTHVMNRRMAAFGEAKVLGARDGLRFAGQVESAEKGTYYNYHRNYVPGLGRYLTRDPIGMRGGINQFYYAAGNPMKLVDSLGLQAQCFQEESDALKHAANRANALSFNDKGFNREFCALVYYAGCSDQYCISRFTASDMSRDIASKIGECPLPCEGLGVPEGYTVVAGVHSHGAFSFRKNREEFSKGDRDWAAHCKIDLHLATPCGQHKKVSQDGTETTLGVVGHLTKDPASTLEACANQLR